MQNIVNKKTHDFENVMASYILKNPKLLLEDKDKTLGLLINSLSHLNPMEILDKGYSIVKLDGNVINSSKKIKKGSIIDITFAKGKVKANVMEVKNEK